MLLFVPMVHLPGAICTVDRIVWTLVLRRLSFGGAAWVLAVIAGSRWLIPVGRVLIAITALFFGVQHFLHPLALPGVPLVKLTPDWVPVRPAIDYLTDALLLAAG